MTTQEILDSLFPAYDGLFGFSLSFGEGSEGFLGVVQNLLTVLFVLLVVVWIAMALYIGIKFIVSAGGEAFQAAITSLKNLFIGITLAIVFLIVLGFIVNMFWGESQSNSEGLTTEPVNCSTDELTCQNPNGSLVCREKTLVRYTCRSYILCDPGQLHCKAGDGSLSCLYEEPGSDSCSDFGLENY